MLGFCAPDRNDRELQKTVDVLLAYGVDFHSHSHNWGSPLHLASFLGHQRIASLILERGGDVNSLGGRFETPLLAAIAGNQRDIVRMLLCNGADAKYHSAEHGSLLYFAGGHSTGEIVQMLLQFGANINERYDTVRRPLGAVLSRETMFYPANKIFLEIISYPEDRLLLGHGIEKFKILEAFLQDKTPVEIAGSDLINAIKYSSLDDDLVLKILLGYDQAIIVSENVLIAALEDAAGKEIIPYLIKRSGGLGVTESMLRAVRSPDKLSELLRCRPLCQITPDIIQSASMSPICRATSACDQQAIST